MKRGSKMVEDLEFRQWVEGRSGWKIGDSEPGADHAPREIVVGARVFDYPGRAAARLFIEMNTNRFSHHLFSVHISVPFSAGPEETYHGPLMAVTEWAANRERLLTLPLRIAEARTYGQALELARKLGARGEWMASYIFDLDYHDLSTFQLHRQLIRVCAPHLQGGSN